MKINLSGFSAACLAATLVVTVVRCSCDRSPAAGDPPADAAAAPVAVKADELRFTPVSVRSWAESRSTLYVVEDKERGVLVYVMWYGDRGVALAAVRGAVAPRTPSDVGTADGAATHTLPDAGTAEGRGGQK